MKPLDDKKTVEQNKLLEEELSNERKEWNSKITELVYMMRENRKLAEAQVIQLSYRQQVQERLATYRILIDKRQGMLDVQLRDRFREYTIGYDIKLNGT